MLTKPLLVVPAISKDDTIKFILPKDEIVLEQEVAPNAWAILELCNGINDIVTITEKLKGIPKNFVVGFLSDLNELGVVADSRSVYKRFHEISSNPSVYPSDITDEEIAAHVASPRMPVHDGRAYSISPNLDSALVRLQSLRSSCRSFTGEPLSIDDVGGVLDVGYSLSRHAVPSAGSLYPMKIFAIALEAQQDFPAGYYEYDNERDQLVLFNEQPDPQRICFALNDVELPFGASIVFVIAADPDRQPHKYSNRGYRFMAIEAGHIAQNISLGAVERGLATCELGGLLDGVIADELELNGCLPFLAIALGKAAGEPREASSQLLARFVKEMVGEDKPVVGAWLVDDTFPDNYGKSYFQFLARTRNGQITSGISTSWADAQLRAIAEGYERQRAAGEFHNVHRSSARSLRDEWLDPRVVAPLTDDQYDKLPYLQRFDEDVELEWVTGVDNAGRHVNVPIDLVFYPFKIQGRKPVVDTCSSGFAAYTNLREAVGRGLLELVERDSMMRSWYERRSPKRLTYPILPVHLQRRVSYWNERGREVFVLDLSQHGVTVIEVVITAGEYPCFVSGAASSIVSFEGAAIKAFQEAESRLIYGLNEPTVRTIDPADVHSVLDHELVYAQSRRYHEYVRFLFDGDFSDVAPVPSASIDYLKEKFRIVTVDVSEEYSSLRVVKVLSPELIPISFGYGTGHYSHHTLSGVDDSSIAMPHYFA